MKSKNIDYICFAGHSHLDWGGVLETLIELKRQGNKVRVLSGQNIGSYVESKGLLFEDIGLGYFRARKADETIEDTLAYHQFHNFFDTKSIEDTFVQGLDSIRKNHTDIILSDPLCKTGPLISIKTRIPYAVLGPYNYKPEGKVEDDNHAAIEKFVREFSSITERYGIADGLNLPLVENSPWLNIVYSTPEFDRELHEPNITYVGSDPLARLGNPRRDRLNVFYSSGTIFWDQEQIDAVLSLAAKFHIHLHITKGNIMPHINCRENVTVYDFCDDKKILSEMDILITQGGLGTVTNGIRTALPMLVMPLFWYNQPQAIKVQNYGNGISLNTMEEQKERLQSEFRNLLEHKQYSDNAVRLRENFVSLGGSMKAADLITRSI